VAPNAENFIVFYSTVEGMIIIIFNYVYVRSQDYLGFLHALATTAITMDSGSQLVLKFVDTFKHLNEATSLIEFLTMLSEQMCHAQGTNMATQTPQVDVFSHLATMVCNTKKYTL